MSEDLWATFKPLCVDLREIDPELVLAGGYGLFLRQQWARSEAAEPTAVNLAHWKDATPRSTLDLDLVVSLDLIGMPPRQQEVMNALERHGFQVVPNNARWQFEKVLGPGRSVLVDFHAAPPREARADVRVQSRRVKPHPSLKNHGIHGRENPEAAGCHLHPFRFHREGVEISVPNPVTQSIMKLVAMADRFASSQDLAKPPESRLRDELDARKHAQDLCRTVALMTANERRVTGEVCDYLRGSDSFQRSAREFDAYFGSEPAWGTQAVKEFWRPEDLSLMRGLLADWLTI